MKKAKAVTAALAVATFAAAAQATVFVDERFNGSVPPAGWFNYSQYGGYWERSMLEGPAPPFALATAAAPWNQPEVAIACMATYDMSVPVNNILYYRFHQRFTYGVYSTGLSVAFYLYYPDSSQKFHERTDLWNTRWVIVRAAWRCTGKAVSSMHPGGCCLWLDTVQLSDVPFTAAAPISLGRIRALFR
jgi:hypothetical protein